MYYVLYGVDYTGTFCLSRGHHKLSYSLKVANLELKHFNYLYILKESKPYNYPFGNMHPKLNNKQFVVKIEPKGEKGNG